MIQVRSSRTVLVAAALGLIGNLAVAQNRMPPIPADKVTAEQKESVKEFQAVRGHRG